MKIERKHIQNLRIKPFSVRVNDYKHGHEAKLWCHSDKF